MQNFLSFGNQPTEIQLDASETTVIMGKNGAGKSTMLDALAFVLYGKPYRGINKPQLVNSVNQGKCLVTVEFTIGKHEYLIKRGIKPAVFEIYDNGVMADQEARVADYQDHLEKNILKMNYTAFTQIVVLGKATYVPFMRLKLSDRRQLIEELLGLTIFSKMNEVMKRRLSVLKDDVAAIASSINVVVEKIKLRKQYIDKLSTNQKADIESIDADIIVNRGHISKAQKELEELADIKTALLTKTEKYDVTSNQKSEMDKFRYKFSSKINSINKDVRFFTDNDVCPTCQQNITEEFKTETLTHRNDKLDGLQSDLEKLDGAIEKTSIILDEMGEVLSDIRKLDLKEGSVKTSIREIEKVVTTLQKRKDKTTDTVDIQTERDILDVLHTEHGVLQDTRAENNTVMGHYQSIGTMLKDTGIKSMIVQKYLPIFNQLINQYLVKLGFLIKFELDDTFNETILSRFKDKFSYASFSEGEKLRLDLAILLTWREISKMKNAMSTNLLIMDEIFDSSLDQSGVDGFIDLIPKMENINIFVITHTEGKLVDKFKSSIEVRKDGNFSVLTY